MAYSTLNKTKTGDCSFCPEQNTSVVKIGKLYYCFNKCYKNHKTSEALKKHHQKQALPSQSSKIRMLSNSMANKLVVNKAASDFEALQKFFKEAAERISNNPHCMECGKFIPVSFYRAATAHVLPKRKEYGFPSIACHTENYLVLGAGCGCHNKYDKSWEDAAQMKIWPVAVEKFLKLYPLIDQKERKNIPEVFRQEVL